jgi:EmrB/QacA subfamily drug resistance transporter
MSTVALRSPAGTWIMVSAILASAMAFIDSTALNVVLPSLQQSLHATGADLFWILNAYLLMLAALILIGGSLGDQLGRKRVFMGGIFIFIMGSAACGFSSSTGLLIICRIIQGIGGAFMIPGSLSLISSSIDEKERGKAIGTWSSITTVVTIGGPIMGGALADAGLWRYIFFINVPLGLTALLILWRKVPESRNEKADQGLDLKGAIAIASGLALLTFGFLRIPAIGWNDWQVLGSLTAGVGLLIAFIVIERRSKNPMMPLGLFSSRLFSGVNALTFFLYAGLSAGTLFLSLNLVQAQGYSQLQAGMTFLPFTFLMITLARYAGSLADKYGPRYLLIAGPAIVGAGMLILSFVGQTRGPSDYWTSFLPGVLVFGLGMAFTVAPLTATVMGSAGQQFSGVASGINNAMSRIANVFANAIFGALAVLLFTGALAQRLNEPGGPQQLSAPQSQQLSAPQSQQLSAPQSQQLSASQRQAIMAQAADLGNAQVPAEVPAAEKAAVSTAYHNAFISAYAGILRISAALALSGALMAFVFVKKGRVN